MHKSDFYCHLARSKQTVAFERFHMARIEIGQYLAVDPRICGGRLIFKGTRILVSDALELLGAGYTNQSVARQYRDLISPEAVSEAKSLVARGFLRKSGQVHLQHLDWQREISL